ncbi:Dihydrolipoyllysine-residue acetyltransferase component of pyruvate dehydrogenase complex, mitochondrial [Papilio xuthus]|uniref:Dihydrolipoamide acetyltransferase component of pyruvate dehydrogenase complex n=1 Tax=Papilio xuthus TaxID=66420 RepID=A0A194PUD8_PAPXU|nr:Dihydrolipoyllysine-residue acetyltransferase component of pyruvate dehydrogenase complex, mitochondrial [Papilio xuthus]
MLRTIIVRNQVLSESLKKAVRVNLTRCMTTELIRRKSSNKFINSESKSGLLALQWRPQIRYYSDLPSHNKVNLPALSPTMESGSIVRWEKKEGDKLGEGDLLCEIETDKATMGFETPEEGYLAKFLIPEGTKGVPVGKLLCIIVENQADVAAFKDFKDDCMYLFLFICDFFFICMGVIYMKTVNSFAMIMLVVRNNQCKQDNKNCYNLGKALVIQQERLRNQRPPKLRMRLRQHPLRLRPPPPPPRPLVPQPLQPPRLLQPPLLLKAEYTPVPWPADWLNSETYDLEVSLPIQGSGLYGSLKSGDLAGAAPLAAAGAVAAPAFASAPAPAPGAAFLDIPLSGMRETIAKRLSAAKQTIPHYQLSATVNIEKTLKMRKDINERLAKEEPGLKISVNDFIVKAVASACKRVPTANSHWMESFIRQFSNVDVSVAVATPTGLITPIVFNADSRGVIDISKTVKELAQKAKDGKLQPQEYQGGTVTVSNLGMYGITMFNAIINPPQSLILACGGLQELVIPDKNEPQGFRVAKFVTFTASADHRVIDGAVGAQWMKALKDNLEDPANMIL